jgi:hypothetical protein
MIRKNSKTVHEAFSRFFESPTRESLRALLKEHVGELRNCDFKEDWPEMGALAKHLIGIGNAGGGCLVLGVKENADKSTSPEGLKQIKDKADISNGLKTYPTYPQEDYQAFVRRLLDEKKVLIEGLIGVGKEI